MGSVSWYWYFCMGSYISTGLLFLPTLLWSCSLLLLCEYLVFLKTIIGPQRVNDSFLLQYVNNLQDPKGKEA